MSDTDISRSKGMRIGCIGRVGKEHFMAGFYHKGAIGMYITINIIPTKEGL
jgi:hypothetical protein